MTDVVEYRVRDERVIAASRDRCFAALVELSTYPRWWTLVAATPDGDTSRLRAGDRFQFAGGQPGGVIVSWPVDVVEIDPPNRIELAYAGVEYVGPTAWELAEACGGTLVAYVYRGVRPVSPRASEHFARWGTRLHSIAIREDALAGLARFLGGPGSELSDDAWRADVERRVVAGVRALG